MNYPAVFKRAGQLFWRYKLLWVLGLILIGSNVPYLIISHLIMRAVVSFQFRLFSSATPDEFIEPILNTFLNPVVLIGGTVVFLLIFTIIWLLSAVVEGALIRAVADLDDGRSCSLREMLSAGIGLLGRFVAIDTILFFPLFLIFLILLLIIGGGLIGTVLQLARSGGTVTGGFGFVSAILTFFFMGLSALSVPVLLGTMFFRLFAFRSAALENLPTRPSIRRAWEIIKGNLGEIVVVFLLLYIVNYGVGMLASVIVLPFSFGGSFLFMGSVVRGQLPQQGTVNLFLLGISLVTLLVMIPTLIYRLYYSAVWTLAYREWQ
ncbi:MAG: hypothetical protein WAM60_05910 [Candidatus Promineifilaceae bacterium]